MMFANHALFGAALGRLVRSKSLALLSGVASHAVGDLIPHKEYPPEADLPISAAIAGWVAWRYGIRSPEMMGVVGGMLPDLEHVPTHYGLIRQNEERFPTHGPCPQPWLHSLGVRPKRDLGQLGWTVAALLVLLAENVPDAQASAIIPTSR